MSLKSLLLSIITGLMAATILCGQNTNVSNGVFFDGEPYIILHPTNSQHITVAWIGALIGQQPAIKTKVSTNGGLTWSAASTLPHIMPGYKSADPSLAYDSDGNLFACYVDYRNDPDSGAVAIAKSNDGGFTWTMHSQAIDAYADGMKLPIDRPWLAINPINNHFIITTKPAPWIPAPNRPYMVSSYDGGLTWEPWRYIDDVGFLTGNLIQAPMAAHTISNDGVLHVMYPSLVFTQNFLPGFIHASSTNSGQTFAYHGAQYAAAGTADQLAKRGYVLRSNPTNPNHLAFAFVSNLLGDLDIFLIESFNAGNTWTSALRINDDPVANGTLQDLVWLDFDNDGDLVITWRDRRAANAPGFGVATEIYGALRNSGENAFSTNFNLSDTSAPYIPLYQDQSGNDFMCVEYTNDTLNVVWGDVRSNKLEIWFERRASTSGTVFIREPIHTEEIPVADFYPNPAREHITFRGKAIDKVEIHDMNGKLCLQKKACAISNLDVSGLAKGAYRITMYTSKEVVNAVLMKE